MASDDSERNRDSGGETNYGFQPSENTYDESGLEDQSQSGPDYTGESHRQAANPIHAHQPGKSGGLSANALKNKEEDGGGPSKMSKVAAGGLGALAGAESKGNDGGGGPFNYTNNGARLSGARGFLKKHKKKLVAGGLAGAGILPILALILFLMAALKIPHFVENVAAWRFAKLTRQYRASVNNVMEEKNALDSLSDEDYKAATQRYGKFKIFDGINRLRPNRVVQSMEAADRIQYNYKETITGRQKLVSITFAPDQDFKSRVTINVPSGKFDKLIHPFRTLDQYKAISDAMDGALRAHDPKIPILTRTLATKLVLEKAGASLKGMAASKYLGSNDQATQLKNIYSQLADNAKKYNDIIVKLNDLTTQYDGIYKQKTDFYNTEWKPAFNDWLKAHGDWQTAYAALQATSTPDEALIQRVSDAGNELDAAVQEFDGKSSVLKEFTDKLDALKGNIDELRGNLASLYEERLQLTQNYAEAGGTLSDRDAKIAIEQETYAAAHRDGGIEGLTSDNEKQLAQQADEAEKTAVNDKTQMGQMVDSGADVPDSVDQAVQDALNPDSLKGMAKKISEGVVGFINPIYDIAVPVCMAYDGSKITHEQVDAQHDSAVSEAAYVISTNDELKQGTNMNTTMANAMNWKLGDVQNSNAMKRVNGKPVNTLDNLSGQRTILGTYGEYTIFNVIHLGMLNDAADSMCPKLTNFWVGLGIGIGNLAVMAIASFFSGGAAGAGEITASKAAEEAADEALTTIVKRMIVTATKKTIKGFAQSGRFAKAFVKDTVKYGAATAAATFLASLIVQQSCGCLNSGLEHSVSFDDNVDDGAEQLSGDMGRANYYARPMNNTEVADAHVSDQAEISYENAHMSSYDRYLALSNPNSLMARTIITTGSLLNRSLFASLLNSLANLFNPVGLSSKLFGAANMKTTYAAGNADTQDYGDVVWGYSNEEITLMSNDATYSSPSENSAVLDQSGKRDEIDSKYSVCYSETIGTLLEDHKIVRSDADGNVKNDGDCSPAQLGPHNPQYGDLVFRWRLEHNYQNTADVLAGIQDPQASSNTLANVGDIPSGTAQQLASQLLSSGNVSFQLPAEKTAMQHIADTGHAVDCGGPAVSPKLLGVLLAASKKYKIVIGVLTDGHHCGDGQHDKGEAADINGVNAPDGSDGTGRFITQDNYNNSKILAQFYTDMGGLLAQVGNGGMGQYQCFANPPAKNPKVTYFSDTCNHLHVDVAN